MDQSELGKTEETQETPSSAELPGSETTVDSEQAASNAVAEDAVARTEVDEQVAPSQEAASDVSAASTDDETAATGDESSSAASEEDAGDEDAGHEGDDHEDDGTGADEVDGLRRGAVVEGRITRTTPTAVYVDIDGREGIVPGRELELMTRKTIESLQEGANVAVFVVNPRNHKGNTILSINQAQEEMDWREAEEYRQSKRVYDGKIGGYNKGGLIVRFGQLRGFVPQSQIGEIRLRTIEGETPEERYSGMVNNNISVKVMEVDRSRNRLILSERAAMREVRQRRKESLITELKVGEVREGRVVSLENFGAFVDIGGAEGLVHLTELSWKHVTHPRQALSVGEKVRVKVISVDADQNRIGLSIKQLLSDPWDEIRAQYGDGALVRATVTKLTKFGAFARLMGDTAVEGLIHISELSEDRVEHPRDVVQKGDELTLRVVKVDVKNRRLGLSLKRVNSAEYLDQDMQRAFRDLEHMPAPEPQPEASAAEAEAPAEPATEQPAEETQPSAAAAVQEAAQTAADAVETVVEKAADAAEAVAEAAQSAVEEVRDAVSTTEAEETNAEDAPAEEAPAEAEETPEKTEDPAGEAPVDSTEDPAGDDDERA